MRPGSRRARESITRALAAAVLGCLLLVASVSAQGGEPGTDRPTGSPGSTVVGSGDSRSEGEGPGLVGSPVAIAVGVVLLGGITAAGTLIVLRVTGGRRR